jgi:hypothetical protein
MVQSDLEIDIQRTDSRETFVPARSVHRAYSNPAQFLPIRRYPSILLSVKLPAFSFSIDSGRFRVRFEV